MSGLTSFYRNHSYLFDENDPWCCLVKNYLLTRGIDKTLITSLINESQNPLIQSPQDYLFHLRRLVSLAFLTKGKSSSFQFEMLRKAFTKVKTKGFWNEFQLPKAFYTLGAFLVDLSYSDLSPKQLSKGGILVEMGHHLSDAAVPDLVLNGELALIWLFWGEKQKKESLLIAALKWVYVTLRLFDHKNRPFHGIWMKESDYHPLYFLTLYALLFWMASKYLVSSKIIHLKEVLFASLEDIPQKAFHPSLSFLILMASEFEEGLKESPPLKIHEDFAIEEVDENLGFLLSSQDEMSFVCSFSGVNTGLGALHKDQVKIISFGPHFTPLADSDRYGIYRTSLGSLNPFHDLKIGKRQKKSFIEGWARLISPLTSKVYHHNMTVVQPGKQWLFFSAIGEKNRAILETKLLKYSEADPLYFAFFVSAEKACIRGAPPILPANLHRYFGDSCPVVFEKKGKQLKIDPKYRSKMDIIPLAGKHHFWGANFLLAFAFGKENKNQVFEIS